MCVVSGAAAVQGLFLLPWILLKCFCSVGGMVVVTDVNDFLFFYLRLAAFLQLKFAFLSAFPRPSALELVLCNMKTESFHKAWTFQ